MTQQSPFDEIPKPSASAKKLAINLALVEFEKQAQASCKPDRLINHLHSNNGGSIMSLVKSKLMHTGLASFSVAALGLWIVMDPRVMLPASPEEAERIADSAQITQVPSATVHREAITESMKIGSPQHDASALADSSSSSAVATRFSQQDRPLQSVGQAPQLEQKQDRPLVDIPEVQRDRPQQTAQAQWDRPQQTQSNVSEIASFHHTESVSGRLAPVKPSPIVARESTNIQTESFASNGSVRVSEQPVSTFSVDVDTASYSHVRQRLNQGRLPLASTVRIEEMLNYFDYQYPKPKDLSAPFQPTVVVHPSPWSENKQLVHIGIEGYDISPNEQPDSHIVLLLDVSGSMNAPDKLPLVKQSMGLLLDSLKPTDTVAIVVYAGAAGEVLAPTPVRYKSTIINALNRLHAGGSTAGGQGIALAYSLAQKNLEEGAINRVIIATDGDFNVGQQSPEALKAFISKKRQSGISLSVLGFGRGHYDDQVMQSLAQNGNGVATHIDSLGEAQKVLVHQAHANLFTIANDVKIQMEFNPKTVSEYRLIGYETRALKSEDFNNDKVDSGDVGAGHSVTAIYEITPVGSIDQSIDDLRYQPSTPTVAVTDEYAKEHEQDYGFLSIRFKQPGNQQSQKIMMPIKITPVDLNASLAREVKFATAVVGFGQLLRGQHDAINYSFDDVIDLAQANKGDDPFGYRTEFIQLVRKAKIAQ